MTLYRRGRMEGDSTDGGRTERIEKDRLKSECFLPRGARPGANRDRL
jgi:hypothetical protein